MTVDTLIGKGHFSSDNVQVHLATEVVQQSQELALTALKAVPEAGKPTPSYVAIKQGQTEPYMQFIDWLTEAVERNIDLAPNARESILMSLAMENANSVCKHILQALPKSAGLQEMMEACSKGGTAEESAGLFANAFAAVVKPFLQQGQGDWGRMKGLRCYNCSKMGHVHRQCKQSAQGVPNPVNSTRNAHGRHSATCGRCGKFGHQSDTCYSKFRKDGTPLGNSNPSTKAPRAKTTNQGAWNTSHLPPVAVPEWT